MRKFSPDEPAPEAEAPEIAAPAVTEEQPREGGCFVRNPDGSLARDAAEHGEKEA